MYVCIHIYVYMRIHIYMYTYIHTYTQREREREIHVYIYMNMHISRIFVICDNRNSHTHTHIHTRAHTHNDTQTRTHIRTRAHTHTFLHSKHINLVTHTHSRLQRFNLDCVVVCRQAKYIEKSRSYILDEEAWMTVWLIPTTHGTHPGSFNYNEFQFNSTHVQIGRIWTHASILCTTNKCVRFWFLSQTHLLLVDSFKTQDKILVFTVPKCVCVAWLRRTSEWRSRHPGR